MTSAYHATQAVLLRRRGLVFVPGNERAPLDDDYVKAVEIEWAALGYVPSTRLREQLSRCTLIELKEISARVIHVLAAQLGANYKHQPLFRSFPEGIPDDTAELWLRKVLVHFLQDSEQPCLFCREVGTTHVLDPCKHVVCDRCFDGASYSACPVCEHHVDLASPFFRPSSEQLPSDKEKVQLKLLDLGASLTDAAQKLVLAFCDRKQAMSKSDRDDFESILLDVGEPVLGWLPEKIPVKENVALLFGALFSVVDPAIVLPVAGRYLKTATDVLRFLAVLSGADAGLLPQTRYTKVERSVPTNRWWGAVAKMLGVKVPTRRLEPIYLPIEVRRFRMTRLSRPLRRALLQLLERMPAESLTEDMLRHRSYWVWVGEFLHPHEYAKRYPKVAAAFAVVRKYAPDGTPAPRFRGFYSRLEHSASARDAEGMLKVLRARPGELARRLDHTLRVAGKDERAVEDVVATFTQLAPRLSTPVLLTLYRMLPSRIKPAAARVYFPKGPVTTGISAPDEREPLSPSAVGPAVAAITAELLRRFGEKPAFAAAIVDAALARVMVPFNERTASRAAISLPRGSVVAVPREKIVRMFLHWCQPKKGGQTTDIDLSIGFYKDSWAEAGVCSYYNLKLLDSRRVPIATSGGDLRDAPFPDGASELIDLDWTAALAHGIRYAVMVVNNYSGMPFSLLERGFAGLMLRDDVKGLYFDPRTVELKFDLQGDNGVYMPLVLDLKEGVLHWLDVYTKGQLAFNNVASARRAITKICPTLMDYFGSGVRPSMYQLALLHAASRCQRVYVRDGALRRYERAASEDAASFLMRITRGEGGEGAHASELSARPALAALYRGDLDLAPGSAAYVLFPQRTSATLSASDLIS